MHSTLSIKAAFMALLAIAVSTTVFAQSSKAKVSDLHFMTGTWKLQHEWGEMTEVWSDTAGNNLMCTFRCVKDGKPVFYEFIVIEQEGNTPVMKLRHFAPGSIAWEARDSANAYPLVILQNNKAVFEKADRKTRLTYLRQSPTAMQGLLERQGEDGKWSKDIFDYRLAAD